MSGEFIPNTVAALFTLAIFSFLWKDNPLYKAAESLAVGLSAGYFTVILISTSLKQNLWDPLVQDGQLLLIIPAILGLLMYLRLTRRWTWVSRYPLAFYMGIASGAALSPTILAYVVRQIEYTIVPISFPSFAELGTICSDAFASVGFFEGLILAIVGVLGSVQNLLIVAMVFASLFYFFFSVAHKGFFGGTAKFGIWIIMIAFGAQFGFTVMARISLLIGRVQFLLSDWLGLVNVG